MCVLCLEPCKKAKHPLHCRRWSTSLVWHTPGLRAAVMLSGMQVEKKWVWILETWKLRLSAVIKHWSCSEHCFDFQNPEQPWGKLRGREKKSLIFSYQIEKQNPPNRFFFFAFLSVSMKNEYFNESLKEKIHPEVVIERKHVSLKLQVTKYNQCETKRWNMQPTRSWKLHYWEPCGTYLVLHSLLHHINQQPSIHSPRKSSWSNSTRHFHNNGFLYAGSLPEIMGFIKSNSSMILVKNQFTFCISVQ